jgi:ABC-2 type transport system ATP-binding protein
MSGVQRILETHDLAKRYRRRTWALTGIDLTVPEGGITALVGPNAAGKSTLIKTWVGFERPTRGSVTVGGIDPWKDRSGVLGLVGYVPQSPSLYDGLSVEDHLDLAVQLRPDFDRAYARRRLDELSIPGDQGAKSLSGGQQAQVALALALGTRARILLLDEPLASLDPLARREFLHVLTDAVRTDGATALLSSHIVTDVEQACDRLIVLGIGRVLLHESVAVALAEHAISLTERTNAIASFAAADGSRISLIRGDGDRPATLEEVVLGYLASARSMPVAA